ncbi:MAG: hypothetical protein FD139_2626 [Methylocystaceae bacterium]|nr:MAG: hypothetical protein FD148_2083 [Methylocystaceae bacterium]KAF0214173.1 MAG: hypothetical protein FD172_44 [Methylocystaceae bacterium]TXT43936.1 MAG: hypothetical protein FD139_2626 [Methylocystaceae bacterium]
MADLEAVIDAITKGIFSAIEATCLWHSEGDWGGDYWEVGRESTIQIFAAQALSSVCDSVLLECSTQSFANLDARARAGRVDVVARRSSETFAVEFKKYDGYCNLTDDIVRLSEIVASSSHVTGLIFAPVLYRDGRASDIRYLNEWSNEVLSRLVTLTDGRATLREVLVPKPGRLPMKVRTERDSLAVRTIIVGR